MAIRWHWLSLDPTRTTLAALIGRVNVKLKELEQALTTAPTGGGGGGGTVDTVTANAPITVNSSDPANPVINFTSPLAANNGGTGHAGGYTAGDTLYASSATSLAKRPIGTAGQVYTVNAGATAPEWAAAAGILRDLVYAKETVDSTGATSAVAGITALAVGIGTANPGTIVFEKGTYLIDSALKLHLYSKLKWWFHHGAKFRIDGVKVTFVGHLDAGLSHVFECVNGGYVEFFTDGTDGTEGIWQTDAAFILDVHPEWFGAQGNGVAFDDDALELTSKSIRGWPQTPLNIPSWARGRVCLRPGGDYKISRPWIHGEASEGASIEGGGAQNTQIIYDNPTSEVTWSMTSFSAVDKVTLTSVPAESLVGKWLLPAGPTHIGSADGFTGATQAREITAQVGNEVTTNGSHGWTDTATVFYILDRCILDISGATSFRCGGFSLVTEGGKNGSATMAGTYYHRDARRTLRGSSKGGLTDIECHAKVHMAQFAIGSFTPNQLNWQEDLFTAWHCRALGLRNQWAAGDIGRKLWSQHGWRFGSGQWANPLNYTTTGCVSVNHHYGVGISATNLTWEGGTVQTNSADWFCGNGFQASLRVSGCRTEGPERWIHSSAGTSAFFSATFEHIEVRGSLLTRIAGTGYCKLIRWEIPGALRFKNIRVLEVPDLVQLGPIPGGGIGADYIDTGLTLVADEYKGALLTIYGDGGFPTRGCWEIVSNTAGGRVFIGRNFADDENTGKYSPVATDDYQITLQPVCEFSDVASLKATFEDCGFGGFFKTNMFVKDQVPTKRLPNNSPNIRIRFDATEELDPSGIPIKGTQAGRDAYTLNGVETAPPFDWGDRSDTIDFAGVKAFLHYYSSYQKLRAVGALTIPIGGQYHPSVWVPLPTTGQRLTIELHQDGAGSRAITWQFSAAAPVKWDGGTAPPDGAANSITIAELLFNGTYWLGSWKQWV